MDHIRNPLIATALLFALGNAAQAVDLPHSFQAGETARAADVNANFSALTEAVQALQTALASLQTELSDAQALITDLKEDLAANQSDHVIVVARIEALEQELTGAADFLALKDYVALTPDPYILNQYTVLFSGVNVQIVNGVGDTESINGLGNLIVGYNEPRTQDEHITTPEVCSDGQYGTINTCFFGAGQLWALSHKSGSHNIVGGTRNAYSSYGGLVLGDRNVINRNHATVTGGVVNVARGPFSSISGGRLGTALGDQSSINGGSSNHASGTASNISGGSSNTASGLFSHISGGQYNQASGLASHVSSGTNNTASGDWSNVSGGYYNEASTWRSSILGGSNGSVAGFNETIPAIP